MVAKLVEGSIYGDVGVLSQVLIDLIASKPIQRLKGLSQFGMPDRYYHLEGFSRFDHSLGVMTLLRQLGASDEEQVAGLLHDVSHRAFSHVYDWVVGTAEKENSQDDNHERFIRDSEIPSILTKHGYLVSRIIDYHNFGLLEREIPDLCADRMDYLLREIDANLAKEILKGLRVFDRQIVCADLKTAARLGRAFLTRQNEHWGGQEGSSRYFLLSSILKRALEKGIILKEDFLGDDEQIMEKLEKCSDKLILSVLSELKNKPLRLEKNGPTVRKKFRFIDPAFLEGNSLRKLTEVDTEYSHLLDSARRKNKMGVVVPRFRGSGEKRCL